MALGLASEPSVARACGACDCPGEYPRGRVVPSASDAVPRNVRFFIDLSGLENPKVVMTDAAGQAVELRVERAHPSAEVFWVSSKEPLAPMAAYKLSLNDTWSEAFETGPTSNERAPELGALTLSATAVSAYCKPYEGFGLELASFVDHGQQYNRGLLQVDFGDARGFFPLFALSPTRSATVGDGEEACFGVARVAGLKAGRAQRVTLTFWDSSGHAARLEDVELEPQRIMPGSCGGVNEGADAGLQQEETDGGGTRAESSPEPAADGCALSTRIPRARDVLPVLGLLAYLQVARRQRRRVRGGRDPAQSSERV